MLCAITSVGRFVSAITRAMVNVLPEPGDPEQDLVLVAAVQALDQLGLCARLIAAQLEVGDELKVVGQGGHVTSGIQGQARIPNRTTRRATAEPAGSAGLEERRV